MNFRSKLQHYFKWGALIKLLMLPFALFSLLTLLAIRPIVVVKIFKINPWRIGHLLIEVELARLNAANKSMSERRKYLNIYYVPDRQPANYYLVRKWKQVLPTISGNWGWTLFTIFQKISSKNLIEYPTIRDTNNLLNTFPKILKFSTNEIKRGSQFLESVGCLENKFICLMVRDASYLSTVRKDKSFSQYEYRDSQVSTYKEGAEKLAELGYTIFRMGQIVENPLVSKNPRIIDYATNGMRSEFLDIYLGSHCQFFISTGTGIDSVAQIFRRPMLYVNVIGFYDDLLTNNYIFHPKIYRDRISLKKISLREIAARGLANEVENYRFKDTNTIVEDMTSTEIVDAFLEMAARVEGRYIPNALEIEIRNKVQFMIKTDLKFQGEIRGEFASSFLKKNIEFLS